MITTPYTITEPTMRELSALLGHLRTQEASLRAELTTLTDRISAIEVALQVVHDLSSTDTAPSPSGTVPTPPPDVVIMQEIGGRSTAPIESWAKKLHGLKQVEALRVIARENGGTIRTADAKRIFLEAGMAKGAPKHVAPHIYHMLQAAEDFERVAPGTFQMMTTIAHSPQDEDVSIGMEGASLQEDDER